MPFALSGTEIRPCQYALKLASTALQAAYALSGTEVAYQVWECRGAEVTESPVHMGTTPLRARYTLSGTDLAYAARGRELNGWGER
eukprot:1186684-Rhodomonas_salina.2